MSAVILLAVAGVSLASEAEFLNFAKTFNKRYTSPEEYDLRRKIFSDRFLV